MRDNIVINKSAVKLRAIMRWLEEESETLGGNTMKFTGCWLALRVNLEYMENTCLNSSFLIRDGGGWQE